MIYIGLQAVEAVRGIYPEEFVGINAMPNGIKVNEFNILSVGTTMAYSLMAYQWCQVYIATTTNLLPIERTDAEPDFLPRNSKYSLATTCTSYKVNPSGGGLRESL